MTLSDIKFRLIVTLGPSVMDNIDNLVRINSLGDCIYRINGAHVDSMEAENLIDKVRLVLPDSVIMLDLPGNKIRVNKGIEFSKDKPFRLYSLDINYGEFLSLLDEGDSIKAIDSNHIFEVAQKSDKFVVLKSSSTGLIAENRGIHISGKHKELPFLFEKDLSLIQTAIKKEVTYLSLSYVRNAEDILQVKQLLGSRTKIDIIAKIETVSAVENIKSILSNVDTINIDRGDLSSEIGILNIPVTQSEIIGIAQAQEKNVFLATQFLKNMEENPVPLISEVVGLYESINMGIDGIQLSEETAIGKNPLECAKIVFDIYRILHK